MRASRKIRLIDIYQNNVRIPFFSAASVSGDKFETLNRKSVRRHEFAVNFWAIFGGGPLTKFVLRPSVPTRQDGFLGGE